MKERETTMYLIQKVNQRGYNSNRVEAGAGAGAVLGFRLFSGFAFSTYKSSGREAV